jgi:hypothetical protein
MVIGDGGELKWGSITRVHCIHLYLNDFYWYKQSMTCLIQSDEITWKNGYSVDNGK